MTDQKYTDDEIIKALECCTNCICNHATTDTECPLVKMAFCKNYLMKQSLTLINRQKAEIERLQAVHADMIESLRLAAEANKDMQAEIEAKEEEYADLLGQRNAVEMMVDSSRAEAIKEFAERLKPKLSYYDEVIVDTLVKEMTEGK